MSETYYQLLGVAPNASADEIKKAYRKLSLKYHPDRNKDPEMVSKYQKINEAYETLGDEQKKRQYDMMGHHAFSSGGGGQDMDDPVAEFFQNMFMPHPGFGGSFGGPFGGPNGGFGGPNGGPGPAFAFGGFPFGQGGGPNIRIFRNGVPVNFQNSLQKPTPIVKNLTIHISQILQGSSVPVEIERWVVQEGTKVFEKETMYVKIPSGMDDNEIIVIPDKGNVAADYCKGDVKIIVHIVNDTEIKRNGLDLLYEKKISLKEALCGFHFDLKYLNGKIYTIQNNSGNIIHPGYRKVIPQMGIRRESGDVGSLIILFQIDFPESLSEEKMAQLREIL
jgi:DnaJ-class molecular chaperone